MRQWRKSATLSWYFAENSKNVKLIRFEDLISQPEDVAVELCDFLGVEYHQNMNNPSTYLDGIGRPWHQNTSYKKNSKDNKSRQFNKTALDKWKQVLSEEVLSLIDLTCSKEMSLFGYKPVTNIESTRQCVDILNYEDNYSSCADWIKPYVSYNNFTEILAELKRLDLLESQYVLNDKVQRQLALIPSMYKVLGIKSAF